MTLPNFLIIGAQKCGTTSLHEILNLHPEANMSAVKEINYFTSSKKYEKGLEYYKSYFKDPTEGEIITGEASPGYICHPGVAEKIKKDMGNIKIVIILRDPIKRALSQYWDNRRHLKENLSEKEIIQYYLEPDYNPNRKGYFSRGTYINYIKNYIKLFTRENIHIMILEDLIQDQTGELHKLYSFLGIDKDKGLQELPPASNASTIWANPFYNFFFKNPSYNVFLPKHGRGVSFFGKIKNYNYQLPAEPLLNKLKFFYKPYNVELSELLERPLDKWM